MGANRRTIVKAIAKERIAILCSLAKENAKTNPKRSKRYVELARKIERRYNVRIPKTIKRRLCKKCNAFLIPGYNASVRLLPRRGVVEYVCECGAKRRFGYK
ncbi:MAG: ribonuclease P protein component 4 [Candidatus Micrarchaeia archaeon]